MCMYVKMFIRVCLFINNNDCVIGVDSVDVQLEDETVTVTGSARPSVLLRTLNDAGRTASVCGLGAGAGGSRSRGASVAVFGRHNSAAGTLTSVVRFIQVSDSMLVVDGWVEGLQPGKWAVIRGCMCCGVCLCVVCVCVFVCVFVLCFVCSMCRMFEDIHRRVCLMTCFYSHIVVVVVIV